MENDPFYYENLKADLVAATENKRLLEKQIKEYKDKLEEATPGPYGTPEGKEHLRLYNVLEYLEWNWVWADMEEEAVALEIGRYREEIKQQAMKPQPAPVLYTKEDR